MHRLGSILTSLASACVLAACASAPPPPPSAVDKGDFTAVQRHARELIAFAMARDHIPGLSIALVDDQRVVWSEGFGYADAAARRPASAETVYRVGSISKLFTVALALQEVEGGRLGLDDPVELQLPGFTPRAWNPADRQTITPRLLMTHRSGLPRDVAASFQGACPPRFTQLARHFDGYLVHPPGQIVSYSNVGMTVLGSLLEQVGGAAFEPLMQHGLLEPLGMTHSSFGAAMRETPDTSKSYQGRDELPPVPLRDVPAGGLDSSVEDLSRFMAMMFAAGRSNGRQVLQPAAVAAMLQSQNAGESLDFDTQVGLGWFLQPPGKSPIAHGGMLASHSGAIDGYRSHMALLPEQRLGVVVLANSSTGTWASKHVAETVLQLALAAKTGHPLPAPGPEGSPFATTPIPPAQIQQWVGDYTTSVGHVHVHAPDGKTLQAEVLGHTMALRPREDGRMGLSYKWLGIWPVDLGPLGSLGLSRRAVAGREVLVAHEGPREALSGERLPAAAMDAGARAFNHRLVGRYEVLDAGGGKVEIQGARLREAHGLLMADVDLAQGEQMPGLVLKPLDARHALVLGPLADRGEMLEVSQGPSGQVDLRISGVTLRKVVAPTGEPASPPGPQR